MGFLITLWDIPRSHDYYSFGLSDHSCNHGITSCEHMVWHDDSRPMGQPTTGFRLFAWRLCARPVTDFMEKPNWLIHTLIHEACHALMCIIFFVKIHDFRATHGQGGVVAHDKTDPLRHLFILLAPYTIPLVLGPLLLARWYWADHPSAMPWLQAACAWAIIHHLHGLYHNIRINFWGKDADLTKAGKPLSVVVIATVLLATLGLTARVIWM